MTQNEFYTMLMAALSDGLPSGYYTSQYNGEDIDNAITKTSQLTGRNLLDNWYFANPVNQRGKTEYIKTGNYCIDRWISGADTAKLENDGLLITAPSSGIIFRQAIEKPERFSGKTVTLSIDATVIIGNWYLSDVYNFSAQHANYRINNGVTSWTFPVNSQSSLGNASGVGFWASSVNAQIKVRSIKLELGSQQTLAHQDADGNWVLNEIPDYGEQLARCQRYYQIFATQSLRPANKDDFRPVMRTTPALSTITIGSTTYYTASAEL